MRITFVPSVLVAADENDGAVESRGTIVITWEAELWLLPESLAEAVTVPEEAA